MILRDLTPRDGPRIDTLLSKVRAFTSEERDIALELVDLTITRPGSDDYRFLLANDEADEAGPLLGYLCYGRTPMTRSTYDLYWIATTPERTRRGVASELVRAMERAIARDGGGLVRVETGSREAHGAAVHFYDALGFLRSAHLDDFYAPGDHLLVFTKRVAPRDRSA
ncbi:MAG: GNAT family N-acetyltransferase [Polyangiaceae bacterium]